MDIVVSELSKFYGKQLALDKVSFELKTGEVLGFLGPNGAGKSTCMKILACYLAPNSGDVSVDGKSIFENPKAFRRKIGYLPENNPLYTDMYITDYLAFMAKLQSVEGKKVNESVLKMIEYCGLSREKHKKIGALSKGYRQRVGLAQALIHNPEVLILDEPTTGLDPNQIIEIRELIKKLGKDKTILLSTHILPEVEASCDRIIIINKGKIVADGTAAGLRERSEGMLLFELKLNVENDKPESVLEKLIQLKSCHKAEQIEQETFAFRLYAASQQALHKDVFELCVANNWYIKQLNESGESLEEIFRKLTL